VESSWGLTAGGLRIGRNKQEKLLGGSRTKEAIGEIYSKENLRKEVRNDEVHGKRLFTGGGGGKSVDYGP